MVRAVAQQVRAVIKDKKGLESLEYAVFAVAFLVIIGGIIVALNSAMSTTYSDIGNWITTLANGM
jgi:Flp pilus assembly pilin Flp